MAQKLFSKTKQWVKAQLKLGLGKQVKRIAESGYFDAAHFSGHFPGVSFNSEEAAIRFYLERSDTWSVRCSKNFDGNWYLNQYQDVRESGVNPLLHFLNYGREEGRLPLKNHALAYEHHLWAGHHNIMVPRLESLAADSGENRLQQGYALWALARWYCWTEDFTQAKGHLETFLTDNFDYPDHPGPLLLFIDLLIKSNSLTSATSWIDNGRKRFEANSDLTLLRANLVLAQGTASAPEQRIQLINSVFNSHNLHTLQLKQTDAALTLENLTCRTPQYIDSSEKISVIVPAFNARNVIEIALNCLLQQTWNNLEVLVVDDASNDDTLDVVTAWIDKNRSRFNGKTFDVCAQKENSGAYAVRNIGASLASGDFLTVHDADDYSHPQKIECQIQAIKNNAAHASISFWGRCSPELVFERWRMEDALIYRNVSSLMISRQAFDALGYWDQIRFGADTEYYERLIAVYGASAIVEVLPEVPLSFGLSDEKSLTQTKASHLITQFSGVRKNYMSSARIWHSQNAPNLFMSKNTSQRHFPVPHALLGKNQENGKATDPRDKVRYNPNWDEHWYIRRYKQLQANRVDPVEHFVKEGLTANLDPGPHLSVSGLRWREGMEMNISDVTALPTHPVEAEPEVLTGVSAADMADSVMICAHAADKTLFGAELSLLDMVKAASMSGYNVVVTLPSFENKRYVQALQKHCQAIVLVNDPWWQQGSPVEQASVEKFEYVIRRFNICLVHVNTLLQNSIYTASENLDIPVLTHVREFLSADPELLNTICASAPDAYLRVYNRSVGLIANSLQTKKDIGRQVGLSPEQLARIHVVPNTFECPIQETTKNAGNNAGVKKTLTFGLISSNIEKKGVNDAVALADGLFEKGIKEAEVLLIGPKTDLIEQILLRQAHGAHPLLRYAGYIDSAVDIYNQIDVVLNLSHFTESFGRTVLEGMAFGKPALCYAYGALIDLVDNSRTGVLVPFKDHQALVDQASKLINDTSFYQMLSNEAKKEAMSTYSMNNYTRLICDVYKQAVS